MDKTVKIKLPDKLDCLRCKYNWTPRIEEVTICPRCKSPKWNIPKPSKKFRPDKKGLTPLKNRMDKDQLLNRSEKIQRRLKEKQ